MSWRIWPTSSKKLKPRVSSELSGDTIWRADTCSWRGELCGAPRGPSGPGLCEGLWLPGVFRCHAGTPSDCPMRTKSSHRGGEGRFESLVKCVRRNGVEDCAADTSKPRCTLAPLAFSAPTLHLLGPAALRTEPL
eukprot:6210874-Pleurochrysis_carterae.AAC.1